jgi:hypothetical protein
MTIFNRAFPAFVGLALLAASFAPARAADVMGGADTCYAAAFPREDGPIKELTAIYRKREDIAVGVGIEIEYTEWDVPNEVFGVGAGCTRSGRGLRCSIDCDGGSLTLALADDGRLLLETQYIVTDSSGEGTLLALKEESDGGELVGLFSLAPRGKDAACQPHMTQTFVALEAGDIANRVKDVEQRLNTLGQLLELPDEVFDETTKEAVTQFQQQYRLPVTGIVDEQTSRLLAALVRRGAGGGC